MVFERQFLALGVTCRQTASMSHHAATPAVKKAGVRYRRPYQTRHTYASMMLSAGEHPMWVAGQMGHSDWTMIARVYGRWMPSTNNAAGDKAEALWVNTVEKRS